MRKQYWIYLWEGGVGTGVQIKTKRDYDKMTAWFKRQRGIFHCEERVSRDRKTVSFDVMYAQMGLGI